MASYTLEAAANYLDLSPREVKNLAVEQNWPMTEHRGSVLIGFSLLEEYKNKQIEKEVTININESKKSALYAGSFDLLTNGHLWVINKALSLFDFVHISVSVNKNKSCMFNLSERVSAVNEVLKTLEANNAKVSSLNNQFPVKFAYSNGYKYLLRGIRNVSDYDFEQRLAEGNRKICPEVETVFLMPPSDLSYISSSTVKSMIGFDGWEEEISRMVPKAVFRQLKGKFND